MEVSQGSNSHPPHPTMDKERFLHLHKMTIDLSQFVDKEVTVTLRNGEEYVTTIREVKDQISYPYYFVSPSGNLLTYTLYGSHGVSENFRSRDIVKIEHRHTKPMTESLKDKTLHGIAKVLTPEAIEYVKSHEKYAEVMNELFHEFLTDKFGDMEAEVKGEIAFMLRNSITLV